MAGELNSKALGAAIRKRREDQDMTQAELARRTGLSETSVRRIESGAGTKLRTTTKAALEQALGVRDGAVDRTLRGEATEDEWTVVSLRSRNQPPALVVGDGNVHHRRTAHDTAHVDDEVSGVVIPFRDMNRTMLKALGFDSAMIDQLLWAKEQQARLDEVNRAMPRLPPGSDRAEIDRLNAQAEEFRRTLATVTFPPGVLAAVDDEANEDDDRPADGPKEHQAAASLRGEGSLTIGGPPVPLVVRVTGLIATLAQQEDRSPAAEEALQALHKLLPELWTSTPGEPKDSPEAE